MSHHHSSDDGALRLPIPYCQHSLSPASVDAATRVLRSPLLVKGPENAALEAEVARALQASFAIACSCGTVALELAVRALGIGPGDEVILPSLTWVSTASAVASAGATPVFCDIDPASRCIGPMEVAPWISPRTRAVIAVDFAGWPADVEALQRLLRPRGIPLILDAAHSLGARYQDGRPVGCDGDVELACFSLHPAKTITAGRGGLLTCASPKLAQRVKTLRACGIDQDAVGLRGPWDFVVTEVGGNHFMSEVHAAIARVELTRLEPLVDQRRALFGEWARRLAHLQEDLILPVHPPGSSHNLYVVELRGRADGRSSAGSERRDALVDHLRSSGILAHVHYPLLHRQPAFAALRPAGRSPADADLPHATRHADRALTLPLFPGLREAEMDYVATRLAAALQE